MEEKEMQPGAEKGRARRRRHRKMEKMETETGAGNDPDGRPPMRHPVSLFFLFLFLFFFSHINFLIPRLLASMWLGGSAMWLA